MTSQTPTWPNYIPRSVLSKTDGIPQVRIRFDIYQEDTAKGCFAGAYILPNIPDDSTEPVLECFYDKACANGFGRCKDFGKGDPYLTISTDEDTFYYEWNQQKAFDTYVDSGCSPLVSLGEWKKMHYQFLDEVLSQERCSSPRRWIRAFARLCVPCDVGSAEDLCKRFSRSYLQRLCIGASIPANGNTKQDYAKTIFEAQGRDGLLSDGVNGVAKKYDGPGDRDVEGNPEMSSVRAASYSDSSFVIQVWRNGDWTPAITDLKDYDDGTSPESYEWRVVITGAPNEAMLAERLNHLSTKFNSIAPDDAHTLDTISLYVSGTVSRYTAALDSVKTGYETKIAEFEEFKKKMDSIVAACRKPTTETYTVLDDENSIVAVNKQFPKYDSADAPSALPNYSLGFWRAKQRFGRSGDEVIFDADDLIDAILGEKVVSLVGPPGVGKTSVIHQIAAILGLPISIVQFTRDKPIEQLVGVDKIENGAQVFWDGEITTALRRAATNPDMPYLIVLDEFDHADAAIQSDFHGICEGRNYTLPNGEIIPIHQNSHFVLTRNTTGHGDTTGRHTAANVSDSAFTSRVSCTFNVDYMETVNESALLITHGLDPDEANQLVGFATASRNSVESTDAGESFDGMSEPVCLRHLLSYASARSRGVCIPKAIASCVIGSLPLRDRSVANELAIANVAFEKEEEA